MEQAQHYREKAKSYRQLAEARVLVDDPMAIALFKLADRYEAKAREEERREVQKPDVTGPATARLQYCRERVEQYRRLAQMLSAKNNPAAAEFIRLAQQFETLARAEEAPR